MNEDQRTAVILRLLEEAAPGAKPAGLEADIPFRDQFEFDSVDFVNFVIAIEREYGVTIDGADFPQLSTLAGCLQYLKEKQ